MITDRPSSLVRNRDMSAAWRHVDGVLCALVATTVAVGLAMVYSATSHSSDPTAFLSKQLIFMIVGTGVMAATAAVDYAKLRDWSRLVYAAAVVVLGLVVIPGIGASHNGIRAWFDIGSFQIQPSELAKIAVVVSVASYLGTTVERPGVRQLVVTLAMFGVPMGLIMFQPDLGTNLVFGAIGLTMVVIGGFPAKYLAALALVGVLGVVGILTSDTLDQYQKDRLTSFVDPGASDSAVVYNIKQAQIAISSGGLTGQGYLEGEQTKGGYVPEQQTDFIFTVPGEELGFIGSAARVLLLAGIVWRIWRIATLARDRVGTLLCVGVLAMFVFHIFQSVGMSLGIMPVTGIPLPFVSYGGSSTIAAFAAVGLVLNVHMRRFS